MKQSDQAAANLAPFYFSGVSVFVFTLVCVLCINANPAHAEASQDAAATEPAAKAATETIATKKDNDYQKHEISGGARMWLFRNGYPQPDGRRTSFSFTGEYAYALSPQWQVASELGFTHIFGSNSFTSYTAMVGPQFNFLGSDDGNGIRDSFYAFLRAGVSYNTLTSGTFTYRAGLGKRWALTDHISYSPNISVINQDTYVDDGLASFDLEAELFKFSIHF